MQNGLLARGGDSPWGSSRRRLRPAVFAGRCLRCRAEGPAKEHMVLGIDDRQPRRDANSQMAGKFGGKGGGHGVTGMPKLIGNDRVIGTQHDGLGHDPAWSPGRKRIGHGLRQAAVGTQDVKGACRAGKTSEPKGLQSLFGPGTVTLDQPGAYGQGDEGPRHEKRRFQRTPSPPGMGRAYAGTNVGLRCIHGIFT